MTLGRRSIFAGLEHILIALSDLPIRFQVVGSNKRGIQAPRCASKDFPNAGEERLCFGRSRHLALLLIHSSMPPGSYDGASARLSARINGPVSLRPETKFAAPVNMYISIP